MTPASHNRRRLVTRRATAVALAVAIAAAGVVTAIAAVGGDSSGGSSIGIRALGNASIGNSKGSSGQAIFTTPATLKPGGTASATVTITNTGDPSTLSLSKSNLKDVKGAISDDLGLKVVDSKTPGTPIYDGLLSAMPTKNLGDWANGEAHTYTFTVSLPHTVGNADQGAVTTVDFNWNATALELPDNGGGGTTTTQQPPVDTGGGDTGNGGGGGTTTSSPPPPPSAPTLTLGGAATQKTPDFVTFFGACNQNCTLNIGGTVSVPGASKVFKLGNTSKALRAGVKTKVTVRFPAKVRAAIRKALRKHKTVTVSLRITTKNAAGASSTSTRRIKIRK